MLSKGEKQCQTFSPSPQASLTLFSNSGKLDYVLGQTGLRQDYLEFFGNCPMGYEIHILDSGTSSNLLARPILIGQSDPGTVLQHRVMANQLTPGEAGKCHSGVQRQRGF